MSTTIHVQYLLSGVAMLHCADVLEDRYINNMDQVKASFGWMI